METTATTLVTALINEGRQQHGQIEAIAVPSDLFAQVQDEVLAAGGDVGFDSVMVDGVTVTAGATPDDTPLVTPPGATDPIPLTRDA
jgi:hypothetical protein